MSTWTELVCMKVYRVRGSNEDAAQAVQDKDFESAKRHVEQASSAFQEVHVAGWGAL